MRQWFDRRPDLIPDSLLRNSQVIRALQVQPKLGSGAEEMPDSQGSIGRDGSLSPQDLRDAIRRDMERSSERCRAHSKLLELVSQDLPRMNCRSSHLEISSVVVNDFTVDRLVGTVRPFEADAPLGVDPDAELAGPIASERFESVTRERPQ
jgi:hypothetical protein